MIRNSFIFLDRVREKTEKSLWKQGITDWNSFIFTERIKGISQRRKVYYQRMISKAQTALYSFDSGFFAGLMPESENWRLYEFFKDEAVFLDIETSGVTADDRITVMGVFDGITTRSMIRGVNLDIEALKEELSKYKLIITFNGSSFDIPFIRKRYPGLLPDVPHIDLRTAAARIGLKGGLKEIEKKLGIKRNNKIIERLYGGDPYRLWRMYRASGDEHYLNLLVEYNEEDVVNLRPIADHCYNELRNMCEKEFKN